LAVDIYSLVARLSNPAAVKWVLRLLAAGLVAVVVFSTARSANEYAAMHGIQGGMHIGRCVEHDANRQTAWKCHGSFAGEDGSYIPDVVMIVTGSPLGEPTGTYPAMVASATSTTAYPPGSQDYVADIVVAVFTVGFAGALVYHSMPSVMGRRLNTAGPRRRSGHQTRRRRRLGSVYR
jgi:hypothetical protein